jgi:hypothetical protein
MAEKSVEKEPAVLERKAIIKNADMSEDMQKDAVECASQVRHSHTHMLCIGFLYTINE